jgi:hypothetical protein
MRAPRIADPEQTMVYDLPSRRVLRATRSLCVAALCLPAAACFGAAERPLAGPDPSDPAARVPPAAYRSTLGGYSSRRPVEPAPWREQNERVAPTRRE